MSQEHPKILIVSHNAFSKTLNNGKTLTSIFSDWPKGRIAQLYFQNEVPDFSVCDNFYCMTDENMIFSKKSEVGREITIQDGETIVKSSSPIHSYARRKPLPIFSFIRNLIWKTNKWDNENLYNWIERFSPDAIFFVGGGSAFAYDIVNKISKKYNIPVNLYYTDDYITPVPTISLFWWINWALLRISLNGTLKHVKYIMVIGQDMATEYSAKFKKTCVPIMNSIDIEKYSKTPIKNYRTKENVLKIGYFGGLHLNRWKSLSRVGEIIKEVSIEKGVEISLSIFSSQLPDGGILKAITNPPYIEFKGSLNEQALIETMNKYDMLIHVESFELRMKYKTRLSISTKIPEYLASGKPILAVGPSEISSIKYLKESGLVYIVDSLKNKNIKRVLEKILEEVDTHHALGIEGRRLAETKHSIENNKRTIVDIISRSI